MICDVTHINIIPTFGKNQIELFIIHKQCIEHTMHSQELTVLHSLSHRVILTKALELYIYVILAIWSFLPLC